MNRQTQLACLLYLSAALTSRQAAATEADTKCPPASQRRAALRIKDSDAWLLACGTAPDGSILLAGLKLPEEEERTGKATLRVSQSAAGTKPTESKPAEFKLDAKLFVRWEGPELEIRADKLSEVPVLRISYRAQTGEDYFSSSETVTFVASTGTGLTHVWTGEGSSARTSMDLCYEDREARFSLNRDGSLQRTVKSEYTLNKANYQSDVPALRQILKECRGARPASTKIPLSVRLR